MWIYYNALRQQSTVVPHGDVPRQGDNLDIILACPLYWASKNNAGRVSLYYKTPASNAVQLGLSATLTQRRFHKMHDSEITFGLEDGKAYDTYEFKLFYGSCPATKDAGNLLVQFCKDPPSGETSSNSQLFAYSKIFVEKSLFTPDSSQITSSQFQSLLTIVGQLSAPKEINMEGTEAVEQGSEAPIKITAFLGVGNISGKLKLSKSIPENGETLVATASDPGIRLIEAEGSTVSNEKISDSKWVHHYSTAPISVHGKTLDGSDRELFLVAKENTYGGTEEPSEADLPYYGEDDLSEAHLLELHCYEADAGDEITVSGSVPLTYDYSKSAEDSINDVVNPLGLYWADDEKGETD